MISLKFYNSFTRKKEEFIPVESQCIKMYACGPTVYNHIHLGNARSAVFADLVFRVLSKVFPKVVYARNITDVDDKIVKAAAERGISSSELSKEFTFAFRKMTSDLFCLQPTFEPKATEHIDDILSMIESLIDKGYAYVSDGDVYFDVSKFKDYGFLSGINSDNRLSGYRIDVKINKNNDEDFVLWKKIEGHNPEPVWKTKWSIGRPGWHIECSAMAHRYLGENFDIHCGGEDLKFPHHENEIAQSRCAFPGSSFARFWLHNGLLKVEGLKMSKSLGNFILAKDLVRNSKSGEILRYIFLCSHYRSSLSWMPDSISSAKSAIDRFYDLLFNNYDVFLGLAEEISSFNDLSLSDLDYEFLSPILDDINTPVAIAKMHDMVTKANSIKLLNSKKETLIKNILICGKFLGILNHTPDEWFNESKSVDYVESLVNERNEARRKRDYALADSIRDKLKSMGIEILDCQDDQTRWRFND